MGMMQRFRRGGMVLLLALMAPAVAVSNDSLSIYGLKGYGYTLSPIPVRGFYAQSGVVYAKHDEGDILSVPVTATYGDGKFWEAAVGGHWESWENDDADVDETGPGDLFIGGKIRFLGGDKGMPLDLAVMPYLLIPTGNRDKFIGDLYGANPSPEDDVSYGVNLLLGRRWDRVYAAANFGVHFVDTDLDYIDSTSLFIGLAMEYQLSESLTSYVEFFTMENKLDFRCDPCADSGDGDDSREIGGGLAWVKHRWGVKVHAGFGLSDTSPDFRLMGLVNVNLF